MNKSQLFKQAHKLAKKIIQAGDNYRVTFGACLKMIASMFKAPSVLLANSSEFYKAEGVYVLDDKMQVNMDVNSEMYALVKSGKSFFLSRLCGGESSAFSGVCHEIFLSRLCGGE